MNYILCASAINIGPSVIAKWEIYVSSKAAWRIFISEKEIELRLQQMKFFGIPAVADAGAPHLIWPIQPGSKIHIFLRNKIGKWTGGDLI